MKSKAIRPEDIAASIVATLLFGKSRDVSALVTLLVSDFAYHPERIIEAIARPREHFTALSIEYPDHAPSILASEPAVARVVAIAFSRWSQLEQWRELVEVGQRVLEPGAGRITYGETKSDELLHSLFPGLSIAEDYRGLPTPCLRSVAQAIAES